MANVANKTVDYSVRADIGANKQMKVIDNSASVQLPSIEYSTDTIKGAGILGEIDWPSYAAPGAMTATLNMRVDGADGAALLAPEKRILEVRWVVDQFNTSNVSISFDAHKVYMVCVPKKGDPGKVEKGAATEGSYEYEVLAYKKTVNGKVVIDIDKLANRFIINGTDHMQKVKSFL